MFATADNLKEQIMKKETQEPDRDKAIQTVIQFLLRIQASWASWMERKTKSFSPGTWYILLLLFVTVSIAFNSWLIYDSLMEREKEEIYLSTRKERAYPGIGETGRNDSLSTSPPTDSLSANYLRASP